MKKFNCPFCNEKYYKENLIKHIDKEHDDELPKDYTAYRMVYDIVNNKHGHGICTECGRPTQWNEKRQKYNRLCGRKECYEKVKKTYQSRMLRVYNKVHLLDDPQHQEKMLAGRRISGKYKWSDGKVFTYTGQYEKNLMEFLDTVLHYKSNEIIAPGPILEYEFKGKKHHWITDFLILPYNLIIEVKDGGNNPNTRSMPEYRSKQLYKEKMITSQGVYSYLRLTNNDFSQLLTILAELKMKVVDDTDKNPLFRINENAFEVYALSKDAKELEYKVQLAQEDFLDKIEKYSGILSVREEQYLTDNPQTEERIQILYEIQPLYEFVNNRHKETFNRTISNLMEELTYNDKYKPYSFSYYPIDEHNFLDGIALGIIDKKTFD